MRSLMKSQDAHDENWYILLLGIPRPVKRVTIAPGIELRPLDSPLSVFDLAAAGSVGFHGWSILESVAEMCSGEIESVKDSATIPGYNTLNRAWLASAMLVLRGFTRHVAVACSAYSWSIIAGYKERNASVFRQQMEDEGVEAAVFNPRHQLPRFRGRLLDFHLVLLTNENARTDEVRDGDVQWIYEHFETFNRLAAQSVSFRFALEAAIDWRFAKDTRSAIARLWGGIEAVFGVKSELTYRIALLSASLLEERGDARKTKFEAVKKLYGLRSKAVHGETLSDREMATALNDSCDLLTDLLLLSINRGHVLGDNDFDKAIFY